MLAEEPFCRICERHNEVTHLSISTICDHIKPLAEGGTNERSNLQGLCLKHSDEKTAAESARAQGRQAPTMRPRVTTGIDGWPVA